MGAGFRADMAESEGFRYSCSILYKNGVSSGELGAAYPWLKRLEQTMNRLEPENVRPQKRHAGGERFRRILLGLRT